MLILWIFLLSDVIFLPLGCGLFTGTVYPLLIRWKKEKICLNVKSMITNSSEVKWLPFLIHENKLLLTPHRQATLIFSFTDNFSFHLVDIFSLSWLLSVTQGLSRWLLIFQKQALCRAVSKQWSICQIYVNNGKQMQQGQVLLLSKLRAGVSFIKTF